MSPFSVDQEDVVHASGDGDGRTGMDKETGESRSGGTSHPLGHCDDCGEALILRPCLNCAELQQIEAGR
jgi:hypothetical protein